MKCLSVHQPFATLLCLGARRYETRGWRTGYRGVLAIHASRVFPKRLRLLCATEPWRSLLKAAGVRGPNDLPRGVVVGIATLRACWPTRAVLARLDDREFALGEFRLGRWAWEFGDPRLLPIQVAARGRLGVYEVLFRGECPEGCRGGLPGRPA
jgi:hypothetical protein